MYVYAICVDVLVFLGTATGSSYIVFISTSGMLRFICSGSIEGGDKVDVDMTLESVDCGVNELGKMRMMCWNVSGRSRNDGTNGDESVEDRDIRAKIINSGQPDIVCLTETWLRGDEDVVFNGYEWFGHNRVSVSRKAVRGSGGVGLLVKRWILQDWSVEVVGV